MRTWTFLAVSAVWLAAAPAPAAVIARVVAPAQAQLGTSFDIELRASLSQPTLGWGLDLGFDPALVQRSGAPTIASPWTSVAAADGDGLAGIYFPPAGGVGLSGADVLLAVVRFQAQALGVTQLTLSATISDLGEGFALDPDGFDPSVVFQGAQVTIVPEPHTAALVALGLLGLAVLAAQRRRARQTCSIRSAERTRR
jgi:hypothetical protein